MILSQRRNSNVDEAPDIDDLDAILKEREETRRETSAGGLKGTIMGLKGFGGVDLASFAAPPANLSPVTPPIQTTVTPTPVQIPNSLNTTPLPTPQEEDEGMDDDDFADFDFEAPPAPVPPPPVVVAPPIAASPIPEPIKITETVVEIHATPAVTETQKSRTSSSIQAPISDRRISNSNSNQAGLKSLSTSVAAEPVAPPPPIVETLAEPPLIKVEEVVAVDYDNYDPFDDFEYDAQKPKKTMIMDPKQMREFQTMELGRKSEASHSSGQDKSNSDGHTASRNLSGMNKMKSALAGLVTGAANRISEPPKMAEEAVNEEDPDELLQYGRERSTNTVAAGPVYSRPAMPSNFKIDASMDDVSNLRILDSLVSKTKTNKLQEEALRQEYESKDLKELIAQDLSDISLSDQEIEEPSAQTSPTREASKTKGSLQMNPESAAFRSKEAKLRSKLEELRSKANDKSKMHSIFLGRPQEEFERMAYTYHEEISKVKESTGKLKVDLDSMNNHSARAVLAEISLDNLRPNFYEFFSSKYGTPRCIVPDKTAANFLVGTEKGQVVVFDQKMIENYYSLPLASAADDFPVCMYADWDNDLVWVGMNKGDVWAIKHNPADNTIKKIAHSKEFSPTAEILDLVVSKNKEHIVAIDGEYRVFYSKLEKSKPLDKSRITSTQIFFTKRDVLPHLEMKEVAPDIYLCIITAGVQVTIFEFKPEVKNYKGPTYTKMLEMELDQSGNLDSSILLPLYPIGYDPRKSEISSSSTDPNLVTLADEKGEGDTVRKGRRVSETNESYPLLVKFSDDPNRSLALAVSFKRTLYIFDLLPTPELTFKAHPITEILVRARAVNIGFFSAGKIILMDIYNDFYLIDVPLGVKYSEAHGAIAKQSSNTASDLAGLNPGQAPSTVRIPPVQARGTSIRSTSVRKSFLTNSIDKTSIL